MLRGLELGGCGLEAFAVFIGACELGARVVELPMCRGERLLLGAS